MGTAVSLDTQGSLESLVTAGFQAYQGILVLAECLGIQEFQVTQVFQAYQVTQAYLDTVVYQDTLA